MGNLCIKDDYKKINKITCKCSKCKDTYTTSHGRYSERLSCRFHELDENNFCIGCRRYITNEKFITCYHY